MKHEILEARYHRNGVGGEGFYVGLARVNVDGRTHRMLVTFFPHYDTEGVDYPAGKGPDGHENGRVAVISLDALETQGLAAWRGDHFYGVADSIVARVNADYDARDAARA